MQVHLHRLVLTELFYSCYKEKGEKIYLEEGNFCKNGCTLVLIKITENIYKVSKTKS